jgi:hypothetical protein
MSLRGPLRSNGAAPISLFAFQDIIFAATGIFLLVAILMTLFGKMDMIASEALDETASLRSELMELSEKQTIAQKKLKIIEGDLPSKTSIAIPSIENANDQHSNLWLYRIDDLSDQNNTLRKEADTLYQDLTGHVMAMNRKEHRLELLQSGGYTAISQSGQAIIREGPAHDFREPIFLKVTKDSFTISYIGRSDLNLEYKTQQELRTYIEDTFSPSSQNFLIYLKPSGIQHFGPLKTMLRTMGYQLGYEPVIEGFELK